MDDLDVIRAFLDGARRGQGSALTIAGDALYVDGWWQAAFRLGDGALMVQAEHNAEAASVMEALLEELAGRGLERIPGDHPLTEAIAYAELTLAGVDWDLWAVDEATASSALSARAVADPGPAQWTQNPMEADVDTVRRGDLSAEFATALVGGMPRSRVLAVGLDDEAVRGLEEAVPDCRVEARGPAEAVGACGVLVPQLVIVDATDERGRRFLLEFRAEACGRFVPVAAVTAEEEVPPGADVTLDPRTDPSAWKEQLLKLLP